MSALMSIGKTALYASYAALQTTGNNIANANTPGYSRQQVQLADAPGQFTGAGFFGRGVDVTTVARAYDRVLTNQAVASASVAAADAARLGKLTQLEGVFPIGASGVGYAAGEFLNAFVDLSNNPADASARQVVLSRAQELAARFRAAGDQLGELQRGVVQDVKSTLAGVNALAQRVAVLNHEIAALKGSGQPPNQLLDERDRLVGEIATSLSVTTLEADDGSLGVFIGGGRALVLGDHAAILKAVPDTFDPLRTMLSISEGPVGRLVPSESLGGGALAGLLRFQNDDLAAAGNLLGQLATAVGGGVNRQQALGLDLGNPASTGAPIFALGATQVLGASTNNGSAAFGVSVDDAARVQASDYELVFDGAGFALTRLADRSVAAGSPYTAAQLAAGVQLDGITLRLTGGGATAGDRFVLQPVARSAQDMRVVLASPRALAAAAPFTASVGSANTGSASVASLASVDPAANRTLSATIAFTSNTGNYTWTMSDASTGTGTWTPGAPIALNGFELNLAGVPRSGDTVAVAPTLAVASNNANALAFTRLAGAALVASAGAGAAGETVTDAYASAIANIGVRVQGGQLAAGISRAVAGQAEAQRSSRAGVNLDEEAARLIQFQQSYQAAAKILQVAQSVFDTLLQAAGR